MKNIQNLTMDINKKPFQTITANVGEVASRFVRVTILDNNIPVDLTGVLVSLYAEKIDGKKVFNNVTIEDKTNGIILAELTSQVLAVEGLVKLTLLLVKNNAKLCSKQFLLNVDNSIVDDKAVESTNEFTALVDALGRVNNIDSRFENVNSQLEHIENNVFYNAKIQGGIIGDGSDETSKIQEFLNKLPNNSTAYFPQGTYCFTKLDIRNKENINFVFDGVLKVKEGHKEKHGNFTIHGTNKNLTFNNLTIVGNIDTANTSENELGIHSVIVFGGGANKITMNNTKIINSLLCSITLNGNVKDVFLNNTFVENCGEHVFYMSGGNNDNIHINNLIVEGFGNNNSMLLEHESYIIKSRNDTFKISNKNIYLNGVSIRRNNESSRVLCVIGGDGINNLSVKNCNIEGIVPLILFCFNGDEGMYNVKWENIIFDNIKTSSYIVYNVTGVLDENKINNIYLKNSFINSKHSQSFMTLFNKIENVVFEDSTIIDNVVEIIPRKTSFISCNFNGYKNTKVVARLLNQKGSILFDNCEFNIENEVKASEVFLFKTYENQKIIFNNCIGNFPNYNYMINYFSDTNLEILNCIFNGASTLFSNQIGGSLKAFNSVFNTSSSLLERYTCKFNRASIEKCVNGAGESFTEVEGVLSCNAGSQQAKININSNKIALSKSLSLKHIKIYVSNPNVKYSVNVNMNHESHVYQYVVMFDKALEQNVDIYYFIDINSK